MKLAFQKKKIHLTSPFGCASISSQAHLRWVALGRADSADWPARRAASGRAAAESSTSGRATGRDGRVPVALRRWQSRTRPRCCAQVADACTAQGPAGRHHGVTCLQGASARASMCRPCAAEAGWDGRGGGMAVTTETRRAVAISAWTKRQGRTCCADRFRPVPSPPDDGPTWVLCCA